MIKSIYKLFEQHPIVSTDTRNLPPNCLFFALKGDNFNGNKYAKEALETGASYAIIDEAEFAETENTILVDDVLDTLQKLANYHRNQLTIPIIGITGSNGKTTTKELIKEVLSRKYKVLATAGNFNNHIGVPLTLLSIDRSHDIAIVEMGANHQKEIAMLSSISEPSIGLITNIGKAHIEGFGGYQGVIKGKKELYDYLCASNREVVVNKDDELLMELLSNYDKKITYGSSPADVVGQLITSTPFLELNWSVNEGEKHFVKTQIFGAYNFNNVLVAACLGNHFGVSHDDISAAIAGYLPADNRSQLIKSDSNTIYLDAYNANPSSMKMALQSFSTIEAPKKMVILGDMMELGDESQLEHQKIVQLLTQETKYEIVLVGKAFQDVTVPSFFRQFPSNVELCNWLREKSIRDHHILIKGSRGVQLEKVIEVID